MKSTGKRKAARPKSERNVRTNKAQVAAMLGCSMGDLDLARSMGCTAFENGGRIDVDVLSAFMADPVFQEAKRTLPDESPEVWKLRLEKAKALMAEHKLRVAKGEAWPAEEVRKLIAAGDRAMQDSLRRFLEQEHPPLVTGKSAPEILKVNRKFLDELLTDLSQSRLAAMMQLAKGIPEDAETGAE